MKTLRIGIACYDAMKARTLPIARGEYQLVEGLPAASLASPFAGAGKGRHRKVRPCW